MSECLAAYTGASPADGSYVGFINAYEQFDGTIRISVREQGSAPGVAANYATLDIPPEAWADFLVAALDNGSFGLSQTIEKALVA